MRGSLAQSLALLALIAAAAANDDVNVGGNGSGVDGGEIGAQVCKAATDSVFRLPYPGDCTRFITCNTLGGKSTIYTCDSPLHFNPSIQTCDWPQNAGCDGGTDDGGDDGTDDGGDDGTDDGGDNGGDNPGGSGVCKDATEDRWHLPYPGDCTKFYKCDLASDTSYVFNCPDGLHFNAEIQVCDWPWNAGCQDNEGGNSGPGPDKSSGDCGGGTDEDSSGPKDSSGKSSSSSSSSSSEPCDKSSSSESKSSGDDSSSETKESNDCHGKDSDENNNIGSSNVCKYATADRWHLPHPTDPTKFYKCDLNTGVAHEFDCPDGLVFNAEYQVCAYSVRGRVITSSKTALK